jgi:hypothetical protein
MCGWLERNIQRIQCWKVYKDMVSYLKNMSTRDELALSTKFKRIGHFNIFLKRERVESLRTALINN